MNENVRIVMSPRTAAVVLEFLNNVKLGYNEWETAIAEDLAVWSEQQETQNVWRDLDARFGIPDIKVVSTMQDGLHFEITD